MGQKDVAEKIFEDYDDVFSDYLMISKLMWLKWHGWKKRLLTGLKAISGLWQNTL